MTARLRHIWIVLTSGYWFVPTVMMLASTGLAFGLLYIDNELLGDRIGWLYAGGADGAKTMLSTVAASVITVAGVVFSITIAALTQASSQFGPRLLRNFMRDTGNQMVLGTFIGTFMYCLLVLRTIHGEVADRTAFVPQASVTGAMLLAVASLAVLVYFIHHVSVSLQAPAVVAAVLADLEAAIEHLPPLGSDEPPTAARIPSRDDPGAPAHTARATKAGYLQVVNYSVLLEIAEEADLEMRLAYRPGDYVIKDTPLLHAWPVGPDDDADELTRRINSAFICGRNASNEQDLEHALRQIVEVGVRALSPGINDPFTTINCIDAIGSAVCGVAHRELPPPHHLDGKGRARIIGPTTTFAGFVDTAFNQLRQHGRGNVAVTIRLLDILTACAPQMATDAQRQCLLVHARMVHEDSLGMIAQERDRQAIEQRWTAASASLE